MNNYQVEKFATTNRTSSTTTSTRQTNKFKTVCEKGMSLIAKKITSTSSVTIGLEDRYTGNPDEIGCCQIIMHPFDSLNNYLDRINKQSAMDKFNTIMHNLIFAKRRSNVDNSFYTSTIKTLIEMGSANCHHQCALLAIYLAENGIEENQISFVGFINTQNETDDYNPEHENHTMLHIKYENYGDEGLYLDPLIGKIYESTYFSNNSFPVRLAGLPDQYRKSANHNIGRLTDYYTYTKDNLVTRLLTA